MNNWLVVFYHIYNTAAEQIESIQQQEEHLYLPFILVLCVSYSLFNIAIDNYFRS